MMIAPDGKREEFLADLLVRLDEQLTGGTSGAALDTSAVADDAAQLAEWEADRKCLELLHRVKRHWSPDPDNENTSAENHAAAATPTDDIVTTLGRFRIQRELGHGGLGVVYLAYDPNLRRQVALKVPRPEALLSGDLRRRFLREAEAAARLNHPHLVAVYDSGEDGAACYIASEFCPGPTLAEWLKQRSAPVPIRTAARLVKELAEAVGHAHGRGVLHRDIKPSNVLLATPEGRGASCEQDEQRTKNLPPQPDLLAREQREWLWPKLTDFGMAKLLERDGEETRSGALVGTPAYMAPEQARGNVRELDARTDVYALGAILFEVLTGRRVFAGTSDVEALRQVLFDEPTGPRKLRPEIPRDLEAICLKCLAKSSDARYATAQQLVADLDRFLAGKPTEARPLGAAARVWKWAKRRPALAALWAVVAASAVALLAVVVAYHSRLSEEVVRADAARDAAQREADTSRRLLYTADMRVAHETLKAHNVVQALEILNRNVPRAGAEDLREFTWYYLREQCDPAALTLWGHQKPVMAVAYAPDGNLLASGGGDGAVRLWNPTDGTQLHELRDDTTEITCLAFAPDGQLLAAGNESHAIRLWNPVTGARGRKLSGHTDQVLTLAFSPDNKFLASGGGDATVRIWEIASGMAGATLAGGMEVIRGLAYSPNGDLLFAVDEAGKLHAWRTGDWERLPGAMIPREKFFALAVSRDGARVAAAGRREVIEVWESSAGALNAIGELADGHNEWIQALAYSPTDDLLASAGKDGILRLWRPAESRPYRTHLGHKDRVWSIAWSPDGRHLASGGADGMVKIWPLASEPAEHFRAAPVLIQDCEFSPDGAQLFTGSEDGCVRIWDLEKRALLHEFRAHDDRIGQLRLSADGSLLATRGADYTTKVWELGSFQQLLARSAGPEAGAALAWDANTGLLATTIDEKTVVLLDVRSNRIVRRLPHEAKVRQLRFTPDGRHLVSTSQALLVWDLAAERIVERIDEPHSAVALGHDGRRIVASTESNVTVLELESNRRTSKLVTIGADVSGIAVSPDGRTLAVALLRPQAVELWDLRTQQQLMRLECAAKWIRCVKFSPDGRRLVASGANESGSGTIWEWKVRER